MSSFSYSMIIPARNEEKNIFDCINSIISNKDIDNFDLEIIVVDDHSTDNTVERILSIEYPNLKILNLEDYLKGRKTNSYKKEAINYALETATGEYIIQTDADCIFNQEYLITMNKLLQLHQPDLATCPVQLDPASGLLEHFQVLDMTGMMGLTYAGIESGKWHMANGANMVYNRQQGKLMDLSIASGDDIHRIESMAQNPENKILFFRNKSLIVKTTPLDSLSEFIAQRIRWGTKNRKSGNRHMKWIMIIVYLNALLLCLHPFLTFILGPLAIILFTTHLLLKMSIDYIFLRELSDFFNTNASLKCFFPASIVTILYISIVGTMSLFVNKYRWKGRSVR
ncbi:MAG: glycosyltransferase [Saprospiraceae bacterium]|nr:glycosyltransferase [Saprospiraceae bacterium]